jgi:hypothetical protein
MFNYVKLPEEEEEEELQYIESSKDKESYETIEEDLKHIKLPKYIKSQKFKQSTPLVNDKDADFFD